MGPITKRVPVAHREVIGWNIALNESRSVGRLSGYHPKIRSSIGSTKDGASAAARAAAESNSTGHALTGTRPGCLPLASSRGQR